MILASFFSLEIMIVIFYKSAPDLAIHFSRESHLVGDRGNKKGKKKINTSHIDLFFTKIRPIRRKKKIVNKSNEF
jgi:hypothetical protein